MSLRGERLTVTDAVARMLRSPAIVQATVTSSEYIVWCPKGRTPFCRAPGGTSPSHKTSSDGEWVSGATGDHLGRGVVPSIVAGRACDVDVPDMSTSGV